MAQSIFFFARSWHGIGGMQRLNRDLDRYLSKEYDDRWQCLHPRSQGIMSLYSFAVRAFMQGLQMKKSDQLHLADCSLLPLGMMIRFFSGVRLSVTACGLDIVYGNFLYQWMLRRFLPRADRIVCISRATAREVEKRGVSNEKIVVIPCGTESVMVRGSVSITEHLTMTQPTLISIARLIPRKGIFWFIDRVMPTLLQEFPDLQYVIIGDGPERLRIEHCIHDHQLSSHVTLITDASDEERDAKLSEADLFVMPNIPIEGDMEGFGIVCIEAAMRGIPVVAADIDGLPDAVIEGKTGRLFEMLDEDAAVSIITNMLRKPLDRAVVAQSAAQTFGWPVIIEHYKKYVF